MAALGGDLRQQILGHSDAAKAFRPWWDNMEDGIMYSLVVMGLITLPMTFLSRTPLDCAVHPQLWFREDAASIHNITEVPRYARFLRSYAKKYCTEMNVSPFLRYLPFSLFLVPLIIVFVEKFFISFYNCEMKLEQFYSCLIKGSLEREDVANLDEENVKSSHEIQQTFRNSANIYHSYLYRTTVELFISILLAMYFSAFSDIDGISSALFDCDVHGIPFKCIIPNSKFFWVIYSLALALILLYVTCTIYNLIWIVHPRVGKLDRLLSSCRRRKLHQIDSLDCLRVDNSRPEVRLDMYFDPKGKDFRMLLNLLAECSGLAYSLRILAVFDKHFQRQWRARDIKIIVEEQQTSIQEDKERWPLYGNGARNNGANYDGPTNDEKDVFLQQAEREFRANNSNDSAGGEQGKDGGDDDTKVVERHKCLWVLWNDCSIADFVSRTASKNSILEYTADISPCTEAPVKSFQHHSVPDFTSSSSHSNMAFLPPHLSKPMGFDLNTSMTSMYKYSTRFDGLLEGTEYTVGLSTELDGKTITQVAMEVNKAVKEQKSPPAAAAAKSSDKDDKKEEKKKKKK